MANGEAMAKALAQIMGTVAAISVPLGGASRGHTISFLRSKAIAVILSVLTNIEVA
jgi:hypothetical protein